MNNSSIKNIKAIVFDYGGVIEINKGDSALKRVADSIEIPLADFENEYYKHNHLTNVKNMRWEDMILEVAAAFTDPAELKEKLPSIVKDYRAQRKINTDLLALFPILKKQGLKIAIFSNATSEMRKRINDNGTGALADVIVISGEIGFQKPSKEAFRALFEKLKVRPEEVIFIDDTPKSLENARDIGYTPILFKDNDQLKRDLKNAGILMD